MEFVNEALERVKNLWGIAMDVKDRGIALGKRAWSELPGLARKNAKRLGISGFVLFAGLGVLGVAALYAVYAAILAVDLAFERMWLSAVVVVGALAVCGGVAVLIGGIASYESVKKLRKETEPLVNEAVEVAVGTAQDAYAEVAGLREAADRGKEVALRMLGLLKRAAPLVSVVALVAVLAWLRHRRRKRLLAWTPAVIEQVSRMADLPRIG